MPMSCKTEVLLRSNRAGDRVQSEELESARWPDPSPHTAAVRFTMPTFRGGVLRGLTRLLPVTTLPSERVRNPKRSAHVNRSPVGARASPILNARISSAMWPNDHDTWV